MSAERAGPGTGRVRPRASPARGGGRRRRHGGRARLRIVGRWWRRARRSWLVWGAAATALAVTVCWLFWPYWRLSGQFSEAPRRQPSRLYESPPVVAVGDDLSLRQLLGLLGERGYRRTGGAEPLRVGEMRSEGDHLDVYLRRFPVRTGMQPPARLRVVLRDEVVAALGVDGAAQPSCLLEPRVLTSYFGPGIEDRWPEPVDELPEHVVRAVLAAEDDGFFRHPGFSISGIVRALWVNVRGGEVSQGGSTLTQQLVKNLYLTPDRALSRKIREAAIAVLLEARYPKRRILQAYLNEIYMGRSGSVHLLGIGAAARSYFGVPAAELDLPQAATLAGLIRSPARLSPRVHPEASKARRDEVLARMRALGWIDDDTLERAQKAPLRVRKSTYDLGTARYAADAAAAEAADRFGAGSLADAGFVLVSTLDRDDQEAAEESVRWGVGALEEGWQKGAHAEEPLQSALVSVDPDDGAVRAWVGGRDYGESQFDRVRFAQRQPGSAFKPIVLAAAFAERAATPVDQLADEPLTVVQAGRRWTPQNDDRQYHGTVTVRETIERSLNVPTVRLALMVGLDKVMAWARTLGLEGRLEKVPSMALGSFEVTPLELLRVYTAFANLGETVDIHLLDGVLDRSGRPLEGRPLLPPRRVLEPGVAYLVTSVLEGVVDRGTGRRLRSDGLEDVIAAKSGTSSDRRDSWFIGYSPHRATLVWVGYDGARSTRLSGARAALPIWGRFTLKRRPPGGYAITLPPPDVTTATVDPLSGQLATGRCPEVVTEVFLRDSVPTERCELHDDWRDGGRRPWWKFWERRRRP